MFLIDLLKGKGRPQKDGAKKAVLKAVPFLIPVIAAAAWAMSYQQDGAVIVAQKAEIQNNQAVIDRSGPAIENFRKTNMQINRMKTCLDTVFEGLAYRIQVSDLLLEMTEALPDSIFFTEISMDRTETTRKSSQVKNKNDKPRRVIQRKLKLTVCAFDTIDSDRLVSEYVSHLKNSDVLAELFVDVKPAARRQGVIDEKPATYYEIECVLREQG